MSRFLPPALVDRLHGVEIAARRPMGGNQQGAHRSNRHGASVEFAEYRSYVPGDPPNLIDWSVYARSDKHLIRRFEEETNLTGYVLLDRSESMAWRGTGPMTKLEYACHCAAALAYVLVHQADRVGLATFSSDVLARHAPAGSVPALLPLLDELDRSTPAGKGDIAESLHQVAGFLPRRSLVVVISDLLQGVDAVSKAISHLHHDGHDVRMLHVMDRAELTLPEGGLVEVTDLETAERLEVDLDEVREAYRATVENHLEELRRACQGCPAHYTLVDTDTPFESAVRGVA